MHDDVIAVLERAADTMAYDAQYYYDTRPESKRLKADATTLRAHVDALRIGGGAYDAGHAAGMAEATAKIVAWLRKFAMFLNKAQRSAVESAADNIQSGAHLGPPRVSLTEMGARGFTDKQLGAHLAGEGSE